MISLCDLAPAVRPVSDYESPQLSTIVIAPKQKELGKISCQACLDEAIRRAPLLIAHIFEGERLFDLARPAGDEYENQGDLSSAMVCRIAAELEGVPA